MERVMSFASAEGELVAATIRRSQVETVHQRQGREPTGGLRRSGCPGGGGVI
jgi:hypothetical protein